MKQLTIRLILPAHERQVDEIVSVFKKRDEYYFNNTKWNILSILFFEDDEGAQSVSVLMREAVYAII